MILCHLVPNRYASPLASSILFLFLACPHSPSSHIPPQVIFSFMVPCMIFGNVIKNVDIERAKLVGLLFLFPILTHLLAFSLGKILSLILRYKNEEEEYLLVVAGATFGNHGMRMMIDNFRFFLFYIYSYVKLVYVFLVCPIIFSSFYFYSFVIVYTDIYLQETLSCHFLQQWWGMILIVFLSMYIFIYNHHFYIFIYLFTVIPKDRLLIFQMPQAMV